jgi:hypothetical protein
VLWYLDLDSDLDLLGDLLAFFLLKKKEEKKMET